MKTSYWKASYLNPSALIEALARLRLSAWSDWEHSPDEMGQELGITAKDWRVMWGYQASRESMKNWCWGLWIGKGWAHSMEREWVSLLTISLLYWLRGYGGFGQRGRDWRKPWSCKSLVVILLVPQRRLVEQWLTLVKLTFVLLSHCS